jgi:hypothetical protein
MPGNVKQLHALVKEQASKAMGGKAVANGVHVPN